MAIENAKTFNVRIRNKYDKYENWIASDLKLEAGEIAVAYTSVDVKDDKGADVKHPALLMKVGDGEHTFAELPWLSAKAADVLSVCKNETELTAFVNNVIADAGIASDDAMEALADRVTTAEDAIAALEELVGDEKVADAIANAIKDLDLANNYDAKGAAAAAEAAAKGHANDLNTAMNTRVEKLEAIEHHSHENMDVLGSITADKVTEWDAAEQNAKDYADGLDEAMDARVIALEGKFGDGEGNVESQIAAAVAAEAELREAADAGLQEQIEANDADILALQGLVGDDKVSDAIADAVKVEFCLINEDKVSLKGLTLGTSGFYATEVVSNIKENLGGFPII